MRFCAESAAWPGRNACLWAASGLLLALGLLGAESALAAQLEHGVPEQQAMQSAHARAVGEVPALEEGQASQMARAAIGRVVPDFELRDVGGKTVRLSQYRGKPLLVSFIYTGCFEVCPTQTRTLYEAVKGLDRLLGENQFNVLSIGFNQPFDTPEAMRSFSAQHMIRHRNWAFLSPRPQEVQALTEAFGFSYVATPAGFDHVLGVTVLDAEGRIHTQVLGDRMAADRLGAPLRQLLLWEQDSPAADLGTLASMVERVRILCTVYDAKTGAYRYDYKLILEIISGILFFFSVLVYGVREWLSQRRARLARRAQRALSCQPQAAQAASGSAA